MSAKQCVNCIAYSWSHTGDGAEELKKCSKCKFVHYCSRQCQREHWEKVHSAHCKFLAGGKPFPLNIHQPASCQGCQQESGYTRGGLIPAASTALARPDNPDYGCYLPGYTNVPWQVFHEDFNNRKVSAPLPFPLADLTGQFRTRTEHCLALMQKCNYKLQITGHPLQGRVMKEGIGMGEDMIEFFCEIMATMRVYVWNVYWRAVPGAMTDRFVCNSICSVLDDPDLGKGFYEVLRELDILNPAPRHPDSFSICDTLLVLFTMANIPYHLLETLASLKSALPQDAKELLAASDTQEKTVAKVDTVLQLLSPRMVPWVQVLKVLCDGKLDHLCDHCGSLTTVSGIFTMYQIQEAVISKGEAFVTFSGLGGRFYSCGASLCSKEVIAKMVNAFMVLGSTAEMLEMKYGKIWCDSCFKVGRKGHRCSKCLTKVYCTKECQREDFEVHSKVCREEEVDRKKKGDRREREEVGRKDSEEKKEELNDDVKKVLGRMPNPALRSVVTKVAETLEKVNLE